VVWFLGQLAIESSFLPLDLVYEHRLYLPSTLPALAFASLLLRPGPLLKVRGMAGLVLALGLAAWTWQRNQVWSDPVRLFEDEAAKSPGKARVHANLANAYLAVGRLPEARQHLETALALDPGYRGLRVNLAAMELRGGGDLARARVLLEEEVRRQPRYAAALANLGVVHLRQRQWSEARERLEQALAVQPGDPGILQNLVTALLQLRQTDEALERVRDARARAPGDATLLALEGAVLFHRGERELARERLREALARNPGEPTARAYWERLGRE
jgi:tetratricopeptide (TPR) repeat protein